MQFWRRDDVNIATISANSWNSVLFDLKEKKNSQKNLFYHEHNQQKTKKKYQKHSNRSKKITRCESMHSQSEQQFGKKKFEEKFSFLNQCYFLVTLITSISTRLSGNIVVLQQKLPCIHSFDIIFSINLLMLVLLLYTHK